MVLSCRREYHNVLNLSIIPVNETASYHGIAAECSLAHLPERDERFENLGNTIAAGPDKPRGDLLNRRWYAQDA